MLMAVRALALTVGMSVDQVKVIDSQLNVLLTS